MSYRISLLLGLCLVALSLKGQQGVSLSTGTEFRQRGDGLWESDQLSAALIQYGHAKDAFEAVKAWDSVSYVHLDQAMCHYELGQYRQMASSLYLSDSVARIHLADTHSIWADIFNLQGAADFLLGDVEQAEHNMTRFLSYLQATDASKKDLGIAHSNLAEVFFDKGEYARAIEYHQAALRYVGEESALRHAIYNGLSKSFLRSHQNKEAIKYAKYSIADAQDMSGEDGESKRIISLNGLGSAYLAAEYYDSALQVLHQAEKLNRLNKNWSESTHHNLGYAYRKLEQSEKAIFHLNRSIDLNRKKYGIYYPDVAKDYRHLGQVHIQQGNWKIALPYYQRALHTLAPGFVSPVWQDNPSPDSVSTPLNFLRTLRDKAFALQLAAYQTDSISYLDGAFASISLAETVVLQLRQNFQEDSEQILNEDYLPVFELGMEITETLYRKTGEQEYMEAGFRFSENSKAVLLMAHLRDARARQEAGIPEDIFQEELQLKRKLAYYEREIFVEKNKVGESDTVKLHTWRAKVFALRRKIEALQGELETSYPFYQQLRLQNRTASLESIQAQFTDPNDAVLVYSVGERNLFVFYLSKDEIRWYRTEGVDSLLKTIGSLRALVDNADLASERSRDPAYLANFVSLSNEVSTQIIHPVVQRHLTDLTIVPDGILGYLSFDLLFSEPYSISDSEIDFSLPPYLIKQCAIQYEYTASALISSQARPVSSPRYLGIAPTYALESTSPTGNIQYRSESQAFSPLLYNEAEVEDIYSLMGGKTFLGTEASEATFLVHAGQYDILHLAMHAFTDDQDPMYSGLAFSPQIDGDGIIYAYELYNLVLKAQLIVVSACHTGAGVLAKGEGIISLARAFRYSGAATIAMSLWQADDQATASILRQFYVYLKEGQGYAESLRHAKLDYLFHSKRTAPFYWSTMVLIGRDDAPFGQSPYSMMWLFLGGIAIVSGVWIIVRQKKIL